jgi:flavorubredoxin
MEDLRQSVNETESTQIIQKYSAMIREKPSWVAQIENLLVALEMYRIEEEKAINRLADILSAYGINVSVEEIRQTDTEELLTKVKKETMEVR